MPHIHEASLPPNLYRAAHCPDVGGAGAAITTPQANTITLTAAAGVTAYLYTANNLCEYALGLPSFVSYYLTPENIDHSFDLGWYDPTGTTRHQFERTALNVLSIRSNANTQNFALVMTAGRRYQATLISSPTRLYGIIKDTITQQQEQQSVAWGSAANTPLNFFARASAAGLVATRNIKIQQIAHSLVTP